MTYDLARLVRATNRRRDVVLRPIEVTQTLVRELEAITLQVPRYWNERMRQDVLPAYRQAFERLTTDNEAAPLRDIINGISDGASRLLIQLRPSLEDYVLRVERWHDGKWVGAVQSQAGVGVVNLIEDLHATSEVQSQIEWASGLIRNLSEDQQRRIETSVFRNVADLGRPDDLAREIREIGDISRRRAKFIASDQANKLSGKLDELRHREAGIEEYQWETARDERVRQTHRANQGKVFRWDEPPATTGHPRTEPRCRCTAQAYIPLLDELEDE